MGKSILVLFGALLLISVARVFCEEDTQPRREVIKISIVEKGDEDPTVTATIVDEPPDQHSKRRAFSPMYRRVYQPSMETTHYTVNPVYNPYPRNGMYHASTVYSPSELTQSLGALVNSILQSKPKSPVNKIYIYSKPSHLQSDPVYHVYQEQGSDQRFVPSVEIKPSEIIVRPSGPKHYQLQSSSPPHVGTHPAAGFAAALGSLGVAVTSTSPDSSQSSHRNAPPKFDTRLSSLGPITSQFSSSRPVSASFKVDSQLKVAGSSNSGSAGGSYHLPRVTEATEEASPKDSRNYFQELKGMQKSMKKLQYSPLFFSTSAPKKSILVSEKVKAYTSFMKRPEYFLPKMEPDHRTEPSNFYLKNMRQQPRYDPRPSSLAQYHMPQSSRRESPANHHAFTTQNFEFTPKDAVRKHPPPPTSSEEVVKYRVYESDNKSDVDNSDANARTVAALSEQGYSTQDAIRFLESKRYTVPRDCSSRCLEKNKKNYDPVCGSDERTYLNEDMLVCLSACRDTDTEMDYRGPCN